MTFLVFLKLMLIAILVIVGIFMALMNICLILSYFEFIQTEYGLKKAGKSVCAYTDPDKGEGK